MDLNVSKFKDLLEDELAQFAIRIKNILSDLSKEEDKVDEPKEETPVESAPVEEAPVPEAPAPEEAPEEPQAPVDPA